MVGGASGAPGLTAHAPVALGSSQPRGSVTSQSMTPTAPTSLSFSLFLSSFQTFGIWCVSNHVHYLTLGLMPLYLSLALSLSLGRRSGESTVQESVSAIESVTRHRVLRNIPRFGKCSAASLIRCCITTSFSSGSLLQIVHCLSSLNADEAF